MSAIHPARNTQTAYAPAEADQDPQESQKSSPKTIKSAENATLNRKSSHNDLSGKVEIPSLDDMTSYLLSNETIDKDNFPLLLPSQQKQNIGIPEIMQNYDYEQALRRNREKMEANAILQAQYDEMRREIDTLFRIAQTLALAGEYQQAINCYNKIISLNEKNGSAWIAKGHCYALMEQDFKALTTYQEALKVVPSTQKDEQVWYGIGLLYQKSEDWNNAEVYYRNVLRLEPPANLKAEVLYNIGMVLKSKGDYAESVKMFTNSILTEAFTPTRIVDILCQSGNLQEKMNDTEGALKTYKYALMINENQKSLLCAGWLCFQLDKVEQALIYMKKAEALIPEDLNISYIIARCHLKLKQHTTAYDCIHKCLSKEPTNDIYWGSLGILFAELNQLKQAYECFSKALKLDPKCPENFYNLGCLFELSSQPTDAVSMYEKCLDLDPTFHLAIARMRKMTQINLKNNAIEVQFKHAPFVFNICKEIKPEKPLFSFMPANVPAPQMPILPVKEKPIMTELDYLQAARAKEAKLKQQASREMTEESVKPREAQSIIKPVRLDLLANKLGPQKAPSESGAASREVTSTTEDDVSSLKVSRPQTSEQNGTKLPPVGSLNSLINGLNTFSFLQNNYNNVNNFLINPVMSMKQSVSESEHTSVLLPNRAKTADEFPSVLKGAAPDLAKQLNGLQSLIAKNNMILQNNISPNFSGEGLKPIKTISSPIMRSSLSAKESVKRTENHIEIKVNSGFKAPHKASKSDNDEDVEEPELQKKVKLQTTSKGGAVLPAEN